MQVKVEKLPKSTIKLTVTVPNEKVKEAYEAVLEDAVSKTEITGFRKGNAPKDMVRDKVGVSTLYGEVINNLLQIFYPQAVKENHIAAIANPKVEIKEFDIDKDFEFVATSALRPEIKMGDFKKELQKTYDEMKKDRKTKNEEAIKKGEKIDESHIHLTTNHIIDAMLKTCELEVPELIVEEETERIMSRLVDQAESIGLSLDQYLKAQNKTTEELKKEYGIAAERNVKAEFILSEAIKDADIKVEESEIIDTVKASGVTDAEERKKDPMEYYYVKSILQKNKLITKLLEEIEGEDFHSHNHDH